MAGREVLGAVFGVLVGCSSETTVVVPNCGPGTVAKDGVCVPAEGDGGADGATVDSSTPDDVAVEVSIDSTADALDAAEVETGPVTHPDDAPCPTGLKFPLTPEYEVKNCSDTCGVKKAPECATSCLVPATKVFTFDKTPTRAWIRTPSRPGKSKMCAEPCGSAGVVASVALRAQFDVPDTVLEIRVDPPWYVAGTGLQPAAKCFKGSLNCYRLAPSQAISVYTLDPDAPARNIQVDVISDWKGTGFCP